MLSLDLTPDEVDALFWVLMDALEEEDKRGGGGEPAQRLKQIRAKLSTLRKQSK